MNQPEPIASAIVVAAGSSSRMGFDKMTAELLGVPVVARTVAALAASPLVGEVVLVAPEERMALFWDIARDCGLSGLTRIVPGGSSRQLSVKAGVAQSSSQFPLLCIADGARPFASVALIDRCILLAAERGAACAAVPIKDTIKQADASGKIVATPERSTLWQAQTPQVFRRELYLAALAAADKAGRSDYTDDCQLVEAMGAPVYLSMGDYQNFKITTPEDLPLAAAMADKLWGEGSIN